MSNQYNARFRPAEVLIFNGEIRLIRRRETFEDIIRTEIELPELYWDATVSELVENN